MEMRLQSQGLNMEEASSSGSPSSLGWPFGLSTCMVIHTPPPSPKSCARTPELAFHQQFMNLQTSFLLPFFSDADGGSSSASDTDSRSEAASSFFRDSRRITLGSLIGLPLDTSFRADTHYHVFSARRRSFLPSCGILELLGCGRNSFAIAGDLEASEDEDDELAASSASLPACLHLERSASQGTDAYDTARASLAYEDALSTGSRSPDWNDQFVSCHSILSGGEWTGSADALRLSSEQTATPMSISDSVKSTPRHKSLSSQKAMPRSSSMKSFFSSICCRVDAEPEP
ncbi:hypothetical protein KC19_12G156000 [Ceratodon purpureus]|uniref:Uncharacterized protein n=1 Tax=Ceratodon purpureus TaxID=3225 RepID=A0A8T0G7M7_CERPU|nr:hypothetical protein KC19_12G156000 [Ceratodon purpureus]